MLRRPIGILLSAVLAVAQCLVVLEAPLGSWLATESPNAPATVRGQASNGWPQLQHDPQRSGYTAEEVRPPFTYLWKWNEVPFAGRTQPVVADGRLFIGGLDGVMYARDAHTGAPLWSYPTDGPIRHSAAVYNGHLYFGSYDRHIYALDVVTGVLLWRYETGSSVATAPAVISDTVYTGSTDGMFYALNTANGSPRWAYDVGVPILTSAALSLDGLTVYFGAEDVRAYALNTTDGSLKWQTQLQGQSLADRWPVVAGDTVIYRSQSLYHFHRLLHDGDDVMDLAGPYGGHTLDPAVWAADWARVRPRIVSYLTNNVDRQTFFALDSTTGNLRGVAPVLYTYGNGDSPAPPVVRGEEVFLLYRPRHGIQTDSGSVHVTTRYDAELGRMNLDTLNIEGLTLGPGQVWNRHYRAVSDEPEALSIGGTMLFVDNWERLGGIDVASGELFEVANVADDWPECNGDCQAKPGPMPFFDSYPFPGPRVGEGSPRSGVVIAEGVIYWRVIEGGLAAIAQAGGAQTQTYLWPVDEVARDDQPSDSGGGGKTPSAGAAPPPPLSTYVWSPVPRPIPSPPQDLVARLEEEVQAMVDVGHLTPFFLERGFTSPQAIPGDTTHPEDGMCKFSPGNLYWFDPGELIYTLSLAYPYLSPGLQAQVRSHLAAEMALYPPLSPLPYPATWLSNGTRRESYPVTFLPNSWPPPAPPLSTLYALWTYADATGDWVYLENHWPEIDELFDDKKGQVDSYASIAGAIGYARIAAYLGHATQAQEGENVAVAAMTAGLDFDAFLATANQRYPDARPNSFEGTRAPVFFGLVPDVGQYMQDYASTEVGEYWEGFTDYYDGDFLWYVTRIGAQVEPGESSFHGPELAWSMFLTKAYVLGAKGSELHHYLDRPWGLGDPYYIQKLVAAIEADDSPNLGASVKTADATAPRYGDLLTYHIHIRNYGAPLTYTVTMTDTIPTNLTYIPNSLTATLGMPVFDNGLIRWSDVISDVPEVILTYAVTVATESIQVISNTAVIDAAPIGVYTRTAMIIANGHQWFLPVCSRRSW